jgi:hypothetical protein
MQKHLLFFGCIFFLLFSHQKLRGAYIFAQDEVLLAEGLSVFCDSPGGFYEQVFTAKLFGELPGDTIRYTLDGSDPRSSATALSSVSPVSIIIDPGSTLGGRGRTGGVVLRASVFRTGFEPGQPLTRSFIFLKQVISQVHPGGSWPTASINRQVIDLPMDTRITNNSRYQAFMETALLDLPTISVTTDMKHLFDPQSGIYVNAKYSGREWERPAHVELINPDGSPGFAIDAGIRIRGGWSRHPEFPKHAFRLFFRSDYGASKLQYPLFGEEGVDEFDKIDLRTSQNYSWSKGGWEGKHNTMNRDVFSRDTQRDIGQPYTRSRYYHLYINGLYWGVFQTQERAEARFAESYFGGDRDDYDVVKVEVGEDWNIYEIEATDGNTDAWEEIWNRCQQGFASNEDYFRLLGLNAAGVADTTLNVWVDIDNLIDYMLIIFYGGNFDSPLSKFRGNRDPNNFYAIYNRANKREGFRFMIHDAEHTLLTDGVGPGIGLNENRVNIGSISSDRMTVTRFEKFHPQWLHFKLSENKEYTMRFADRAYHHFFVSGVLHPDTCVKRFRQTADQLDLAIIAESARWGDVGVGNPRTKYDDWIPAVNRVIQDYMPYRTSIVVEQLKAGGLLPGLEPPVVLFDGQSIATDALVISEASTILLRNPNAEGSVFYTIDGTDPRAIGGTRSDAAMVGGNQRVVDVSPGIVVHARIFNGTGWSALRKVQLKAAESSAVGPRSVPLFEAVEGQEPVHLDPADLFSIAEGVPSLDYSVSSDMPDHVEAVFMEDQIILTPLKRGDASIHVEAYDGSQEPIVNSFRMLVHPAPHTCSEGDFVFDSWSSSEPELSYPEHMVFLQSDIDDPGMTDPLLFPYFVAHDDYHANDEDNIGFPYASSGRTRINALGDDGISFINTGRGRDLGGALLALDTRGMSRLQLEWTAGTILRNERMYALRLQYRTSISDAFQDLRINGEVQEYVANTTGHIRYFDAIALPQEMLGQEYLQLLWRYHHVAGSGGPRAELRLDDIFIGTTVDVKEQHRTGIRIFSNGNRIFVHMDQEHGEPAIMRVYNMMGQELMHAVVDAAGQHVFPARLDTGMYIVRVESPGEITTRKVLLSGR